MKVTLEWLKEFIETVASPSQIGDALTMLGLELESIDECELGPVFDFKVTPNRGDCLSVLGLARELAAKDATVYRPTEHFRRMVGPWNAPNLPNENLVEIQSPELCRRYAALTLNVENIGASTEIIQKRLTAAGMRPIDVVVDTTNYVMLELGQPLHAFDRKQLTQGKIVVRTAMPGEKITTLDSVERELAGDMLMICDPQKPVAIAGVMGGENSEVARNARELLLESAHFDPISVRRTRRKLGMSTEASYRFERYVDCDGVLRAALRFLELLQQQTSCTATALHDAYPSPKESPKITVRQSRWNELLGMEVPVAAAAASLNALGFQVREKDGILECMPPSWRADVILEEDVIEEIGRIWGYERIPESLPSGSTPPGGEYGITEFVSNARNAMLRMGFTEIFTNTLTGESLLNSKDEAVKLRNVSSPELTQLRNSLWPALAAAASKNRGRSLALFETGHLFSKQREWRALGMLLNGSLLSEHWSHKNSQSAEFFDIKGIVEELARLLKRKVTFISSTDARLHATRQGAVVADGQTIGLIGEVSRRIAEEFDLAKGTLLAEIDLDALFGSAPAEVTYQPLSPYPEVRRDIAFVIAKEVEYSQIENAVRTGAGEMLEKTWLFDVYEGEGIADGSHSLAVAMTLRLDRTLTDDEANEARERVFAEVEKLGATRR